MENRNVPSPDMPYYRIADFSTSSSLIIYSFRVFFARPIFENFARPFEFVKNNDFSQNGENVTCAFVFQQDCEKSGSASKQ